MGAPVSGIRAAGQQAAEALLSSFQAIGEDERSRHAAVYDYWRSIRGDRDFPTIRDLDPLEISDAGPCSVLLELIDSGEDAEIRHIGERLKTGVDLARIGEAPRRSLLACIAGKLAIVAISRDPLAFEEEFETEAGTARCRVTLLPFSSTGPWVDYVYGFVTSDSGPSEASIAPAIAADTLEERPEDNMDQAEPAPEMPLEPFEQTPEPPVDDAAPTAQDVGDAIEPEPFEEIPEPPVDEAAPTAHGAEPEYPAIEPAAEPAASKFDPFAGVEGYFGNVVSVELNPPATAAAGNHPEEPGREPESPLLGRLAEARAKADEARLARMRSEAALVEGLGAAYDFALEAEDQAEEYFKLVEAQGLKVQLRSPMAPVVRLAFDGRCDEPVIAELEQVLAWALKMNLPRGSLAARIEAEGGIAAIAGGLARGS